MEQLLSLLVWVLILGAAAYAMMYVVDWMKLAPPLDMFAKIIVGLIILILIISMVTGYIPLPRVIR